MQHRIALVALAAALGVAGLTTTTASAAVADPVTIRAEHDYIPAGGRILEAVATVGAGEELTVDDELENPDGYGGNASVDIDPLPNTITVTVHDNNCYDRIEVWIYSGEMTDVATVSDSLYDAGGPTAQIVSDGANGLVNLEWFQGGCPWFTDGNTAVFSYVGTITNDVVVRAEHDLDDEESDGPATYERTGTIGDGEELDDTDLVGNPSDYTGHVTVDIDDVAGIITVTYRDDACYNLVTVTITSDEITNVALDNDQLFNASDPGVELTEVDGVITMRWRGDTGSCYDLTDGNTAVFTFDSPPAETVLPPTGASTGTAAIAAVLCALGALALGVRRRAV